jgi:hypothetical protein
VNVKFSKDDISVSEWREISPKEKLDIIHGLNALLHKQVAVWVGAAAIGATGLSALYVLITAFQFQAAEPEWAKNVVAAVIAASIALIFQNHSAKRR